AGPPLPLAAERAGRVRAPLALLDAHAVAGRGVADEPAHGHRAGLAAAGLGAAHLEAARARDHGLRRDAERAGRIAERDALDAARRDDLDLRQRHGRVDDAALRVLNEHVEL